MLSQKTTQLSIDDNDPTTQNDRPNGHPAGQIISSGKPIPVQDITQEFHNAARALHVGHLVRDESFVLYDAVGALEIMDPKMDGGYLADEEDLEDDYDVLRRLSLGEILGIMDQLFCFEMAWHMGYSLHQTLFTSSYIDRLLDLEPKSLDEAVFDRSNRTQSGNELLHLVLRAFCLGMIKTCGFVNFRVTAEKNYEEEDFVTNLHHRSLLSHLPNDGFIKLLEEAQTFMEEKYSVSDKKLTKAITDRLKLREQLLIAVIPDTLLKTQLRFQWRLCSHLTQLLPEFHRLATKVQDAFSLKLQHKVATTMPPRPIIDISFKEATAYLNMLCLRCEEAYLVMNFNGFSNMLTFVRLYQSRKPQPPVYVRCVLQALVWNDRKVLGDMTSKSLIFTDLAETVLPASNLVDLRNDDVEAPTDSRFTIAQSMELFTRQVVDAVLDTFMVLSMNRARLRRMLCHSVIDWDWIEHEAEKYDQQLRQYRCDQKPGHVGKEDLQEWNPLSSWARCHKVRQMEWLIQMGFELDIYQVDEMAGMYWYLQYLANVRLQELLHSQHCNLIRYGELPKHAKMKRVSLQNNLQFAEFNILEVTAIQTFADGLSCLYSCLSHLGLIPAPYPDYPYSTPALRYDLRMKPFTAILDPPCPSFEQFQALVSLRSTEQTAPEVSKVMKANPKQQALGILEVAAASLQEAKKKWMAISKWTAQEARCMDCEQLWRAEVKNIVRSCVVANLAVDQAKKVVSACEDVEGVKERLGVEVPQSGKSDHTWWIVPAIRVKNP